jgi:hypothetical protein
MVEFSLQDGANKSIMTTLFVNVATGFKDVEFSVETVEVPSHNSIVLPRKNTNQFKMK